MDSIQNLIEIYKQESTAAFYSIPTLFIEKFYEMVLSAYRSENKIFACGNGGNVASVQNLVLDLNMHPFVSDDKTKAATKRNKFHAVSLCDNSAVITGMTNDIGFENIFGSQLVYQGNKNDILFAMSGSGNSKNIIEALKVARNLEMKTVLMTRNQITKAEEFADLVLRISGTSVFPGNVGGNNNNFHYEDCISKVSHIIVGLLKQYVQNEN